MERNSYSVNSRLIGELVEARIYSERVEVWYGGQKVEQLPRLRGPSNYRIDYRHVLVQREMESGRSLLASI